MSNPQESHTSYRRIYEEYLKSLNQEYSNNVPTFNTVFGKWRVDFYSAAFEAYIKLGPRTAYDDDCARWICSHGDLFPEHKYQLTFYFVPYTYVQHIGNALFAEYLYERSEDTPEVRKMLDQIFSENGRSDTSSTSPTASSTSIDNR